MNFFNEEIEKYVLGTLIAYAEYQDDILLNVKTEYFYFDINRLIFKTCQKIESENKKIDMLSVLESLKNNNELKQAGGAYFITKLTDKVGSSVNLSSYILILKELFLKRQMYLHYNNALKELKKDNDVYDVFNSYNAKIESLFDIKENNIFKISDVVKNRLSEIQTLSSERILGITSGISKVDKITSGWQKGDFILLAGRPSMGKTAISLYFAKYPALINNKNVLFFSLEMSKERIADRLISLETGINSRKIQTNDLTEHDWASIDSIIPLFDNNTFKIIDDSDLTAEEIKNIAIIENKKQNLDLIVIDYLQIIKYSEGENANLKIAHISKTLKNLAKKINVPIIALSQLKRTQGVPTLSDLRDSGALEQDADIVIFVHRYDYQGAQCEPEQENLIELIFAKHRNGEIGIVDIKRADDWSKFYDNEEIPFNF